VFDTIAEVVFDTIAEVVFDTVADEAQRLLF
jgi:hypothetical protein